jgi:GTPase SAR1 family protein
MEIDVTHSRFKHPFTCIVAGPTSSGKTVLVRKILQNYKNLFTLQKERLKVFWAYGQWQTLYNEKIENVDCTYIDGLSNENSLTEKGIDLLIIDDLMTELSENKNLTSLFTKGSHHLGISVIFISQNLFQKGSQIRTISLNCHYLILMKNPRDKLQIQCLQKQCFPGKSKHFIDAYTHATSSSFGYFIIDLTQDTPDILRLSSALPFNKSINGHPSRIYYVEK